MSIDGPPTTNPAPENIIPLRPGQYIWRAAGLPFQSPTLHAFINNLRE
jgi:hypothetical protein